MDTRFVRPTAPSTERPTLDAPLSTGEAVRVVLRWLLATIRAKGNGVVSAEDPEFLHDFRVAVRRSRTLLGEMGDALPEARTEHFKAEFRWLGDSTGPVRDLDVWIEKLPDSLRSLPPGTRADLEALELFLQRKRDAARADLVRAMRSARYTRLLEEWEEFLWRPATGGAPRGVPDRAIREVASQRIWKAYRKVLKQGRKIEPTSAPGEYHKLRIRCKKLRYLLEFFGGLYAPDAVAAVIAALKKLQDHLGDFNDCAVQRGLLPGFAHEMASRGGEAAAPAITALGRLESVLQETQQKERGRTERRFARFLRSKNRRMFRELFGPE